MDMSTPTDNKNVVRQKLKKHSRGLLIRLVGLTLTGVALTAIGQPSSTHVLSHIGHDFWEFLFVVHLLFLLFLCINAVMIVKITAQNSLSTKGRATLGLLLIAFGAINGTLSFRGIHSSLTLFSVGLTTVLLVFIYGPVAAKLFYTEKVNG